MRLADHIGRLPPDLLRRLSRIRIEPAPGRSLAKAHFVGLVPVGTYGVHDNGSTLRPIPRGPVSASDAQGVADRNPPVKLHMREAIPDAEWVIHTADLAGQIAEVEASGLVGGLNVEHFRGPTRTIITTRAATQAERNAWVKDFGR